MHPNITQQIFFGDSSLSRLSLLHIVIVYLLKTCILRHFWLLRLFISGCVYKLLNKYRQHSVKHHINISCYFYRCVFWFLLLGEWERERKKAKNSSFLEYKRLHWKRLLYLCLKTTPPQWINGNRRSAKLCRSQVLAIEK